MRCAHAIMDLGGPRSSSLLIQINDARVTPTQHTLQPACQGERGMSTTHADDVRATVVATRVPRSRWRFFVYLMLFTMTAVNYTDRVNLSVAGGLVSNEFSLSPSDLGWLLSAHLWPYIICL